MPTVHDHELRLQQCCAHEPWHPSLLAINETILLYIPMNSNNYTIYTCSASRVNNHASENV